MKKIVFFCLLILSVNAVLIQSVAVDNPLLKNGLRIGILLIAVLIMLVKKQRISLMLFLLINLSVIALLLGKNSDQLSFIFIFIYIQVLFLIKTQKIEKYLLVSSFISFLLIFVFLQLGITFNEIMDHRNRMTYGLQSVAFFYNMVYGTLTLMVIYALKYFKRFKWLIILVSVGVATYFYQTTDLRGGYLSFIAFLMLIPIVPVFSRLTLFRHLIGLTPVFSLGCAFVIARMGDNIAANELLSYRPFLLSSFFEKISFVDVLLSTSVKAYDGISVVDNSYVHLLAGGGIVLSIMIAYLFFKAIQNLFKYKKYIEIAFMLSVCMYFNTESLMVRIENMFVIYFWYLLIRYSLTKIEPEPVKQEVPNKQRKFKRYKIVW